MPFALVESDIPIMTDGAVYVRRIITKVAEEKDNNLEVREIKDEHNNYFIENIISTEDNSLFAKQNVYYYQPATKRIEDVEHNLFQKNKPPSFPNLLSIMNNDEESSAKENHQSINEDNPRSILPNQGSTTTTKDVDFIEVSPKRAKLRKEAHKHLIKQTD